MFGAYLSHPVHLSGEWSGSPSCFIYSSTLGIKFSYHGHIGPEARDDEDGYYGPAGFFADLDQFVIGNGDIAIDSTLKLGSSNLERVYGIGLDAASVEASIMLAGAPNFVVDAIEFWSIR